MVPCSRRAILALAAAAAAWTASPARLAAADSEVEGAKARIQEMIDKGLVLLTDKTLTSGGRVKEFRGLFDHYFAVDAIARWVLGRYWRQANPAQQAEYRRLFEDLITYGYVKRFREYAGQSMQVTGALAIADNTVIVNSQVESTSGGQPIAVDWRVGTRDGTYLVTDVVVANVSLAQTWRSDFASTIQQNNDSIDAFLQTLRERVAALKAEVEGSGR